MGDCTPVLLSLSLLETSDESAALSSAQLAWPLGRSGAWDALA